MNTVKKLELKLFYFLFYGWKQLLPSRPRAGDRAIVNGDLTGFIRKITDDYIEIYGFYREPFGSSAPSQRLMVTETWTRRYDRPQLGKLWREPIYRRDRWDFRGKSYYQGRMVGLNG